MKNLGHRIWAVPGGHIPLKSTGPEPGYISRDEISILNTGELDAEIKLTIYYSNTEPVGPYPINVKSRRVRTIRFNDLINPFAMPLDEDYACVLESNVPVVVQFTRTDTAQAENSMASLMAFPVV